MTFPTSSTLPTRWRTTADTLERFAPAAAVAFRDCASELERELGEAENSTMTIAEAAVASGLSKDHIRHQIARGIIPNAGKRGRPRVRAGDLPRKAITKRSTYDPDADALRLMKPLTPRAS